MNSYLSTIDNRSARSCRELTFTAGIGGFIMFRGQEALIMLCWQAPAVGRLYRILGSSVPTITEDDGQ